MARGVTDDNNYINIANVIRAKNGSNNTYQPGQMADAIDAGWLNTSDATATATDILSGKTAYVGGEKITGTIGTTSNISKSGLEPSTGLVNNLGNAVECVYFSFTRNSGVYLESGATIDIYSPLTNFGDATAEDVAAGKTFTSSDGLLVEGTHVCEGGIDTSDADATASDILSGKSAYVNGVRIEGNIQRQQASTPSVSLDASTGEITASYDLDSGYYTPSATWITKIQLDTQAEQTITPGSEDQTIASGLYLTGVQTIIGDSNLVAGNIKSGVSIFGVDGTFEGSGGVQTQHITSENDTITISGSGTVNVWGYGAVKSTYTTTIYAFVGDGYYKGSSFGTPTKTSASFSISNGTISGLPSGLTALDVLVTIGI